MFAQIDKSARLRENTLEVFGIVPKCKSNLLGEDYVLSTAYGSVDVNFFRNKRGAIMYHAYRKVSGHTTLFELKGWASAIRYSMKQFFHHN